MCAVARMKHSVTRATRYSNQRLSLLLFLLPPPFKKYVEDTEMSQQ